MPFHGVAARLPDANFNTRLFPQIHPYPPRRQTTSEIQVPLHERESIQEVSNPEK
jgi:hypothetical protein